MSVQHDPALAKPFRTSMVNIKIGDRVIAAKRSTRCKVCMHPARALIEERLLLGDPYTDIANWTVSHEAMDIGGVQVPWPPLTLVQLSNHYNRDHCPIDTKIVHELSEQLMTEMGVNYENATARLVNPVLYGKLVLNRGQERLLKGEIQPNVRETLAAAKLLHDIEADTVQADNDRLQAYVDAMEVYFEVVQRIVTVEQWEAIGMTFATNPVLQAVEARLRDVHDAELVED